MSFFYGFRSTSWSRDGVLYRQRVLFTSCWTRPGHGLSGGKSYTLTRRRANKYLQKNILMLVQPAGSSLCTGFSFQNATGLRGKCWSQKVAWSWCWMANPEKCIRFWESSIFHRCFWTHFLLVIFVVTCFHNHPLFFPPSPPFPSLQHGSNLIGMTDLNVPEQLYQYMVGGHRRAQAGANRERHKSPSYQIKVDRNISLSLQFFPYIYTLLISMW